MDSLVKELGINSNNILRATSNDIFAAVVHSCWLKKWLKNEEVHEPINNVDFHLQVGETITYPWKKIFIRVIKKKVSKVLPLPPYKIDNRSESSLTFSQLLQYVSQNNHRNLWKEAYKKYCPNDDTIKDNCVVNLIEHDLLLSEVLSRIYGCTPIRIKCDDTGTFAEYREGNKNVFKSYDAHVNFLAASFILESDNNFFIIYRGHYENSLLDCMNFSLNLIDTNYTRGLFIIYQLLNALKALNDRGLSIGSLTLNDIYLSENLWLQIVPEITNNVCCLDESFINEQNKSKMLYTNTQNIRSTENDYWRDVVVDLEKLCTLWVKGRITNLDYLLHINRLVGRSSDDPQAHFMVPWVTDFTSRNGKNWRDLSKSKFRLNKGDRQLDLTYDVPNCAHQIPHHVTDALSDITCYIYLARRTPKDILCKHVRNTWVPAEYPASIQRIHDWTPDECIPEFYTDPTVFKSIHEDLPVIKKKVSKVLPLPPYKIDNRSESSLTFSQLLQYVSQNNHRNLWKEAYKKYCPNDDTIKDNCVVNLIEHDLLLSEVLSRIYGCTPIRIKCDDTGTFAEYREGNKNVFKSYDAHVNFLAASFILESDNNFFIIYRGHYENSLLDCMNFSPNLIDTNYTRGLFIIYQLLNALKALNDRGLSIGSLTLNDIYLSENLWLQIVPEITNNVCCLDESFINEQNKSKMLYTNTQNIRSTENDYWRDVVVDLEKLCTLWVKGRITNLDYLLHINRLVGRSSDDPQAHFMVPWVTDFTSRNGKNWRDLSKSKFRLNKGDRQLDLTYDVPNCAHQIPHHVTDALSDITCYIYLARRTPKDILCKHVRNTWVPAEYPASIQRIHDWTPDECIPEFYTDPTVFKSIHEDLPDLGIPSWATCVEDFITKHREALESTHVSENLHHWIDITFGYKLSGSPSIKAKNVCLSLVDGHTTIRRGGTVQLLTAPHPPRQSRPLPPTPPRLHYTAPVDNKKSMKSNGSSDEISEEEDESTSLPRHVSRLNIPKQHVRARHKSSRARSLSKSQGKGDSAGRMESRASSHSRHYRVQRSELGKGVIYLPKEFNPVVSIQSIEAVDNFKTKCFFSNSKNKERSNQSVNTSKLYPPIQQEITEESSSFVSEETAFTNHMFLASYEPSYLKKFTNTHTEHMLRERNNGSLNIRYTADGVVYKRFVTENRRKDMLVIGCLIVEIFLHQYMRPLRMHGSFMERINCCRTVLKYNFNSLAKPVSYVASLLLNVQPLKLSTSNEINMGYPERDGEKQCTVTDKGLPPPTAAQLLEPLLMQHLIPFPLNYITLYKLLTTLHEYELTSQELNILYTYQCDGINCQNYLSVDRTKMYFSQKIAEGKIKACASYLNIILTDINSSSQFDVMDIFLTHYIELLNNKDTSVLAAWYLFDIVSKALGPAETKNKLLKHLLNLYDNDDFVINKTEHHKLTDVDTLALSATISKQKFIKLYHHIFLLQLMVRLGVQCFLDYFTQHLVEAVGGYKDICTEVVSPGHLCHNKIMACKKPRYSDDNVKSALSTTTNDNVFSPDTSYGSEKVVTPNIDIIVDSSDLTKDTDMDSKSENELFHFESDKEDPDRSQRNKSSTSSIECFAIKNKNSPSFSEACAETDTVNDSISTPMLNVKITNDDNSDVTERVKGTMSPTIDIPTGSSMFTSYLHFGDDVDVEMRNETVHRQVKSLELNDYQSLASPKASKSYEENVSTKLSEIEPCKISEMSSESLIWLAHRLGPVLTCRYITRNLLKMLTLCYVGKENLLPWEGSDRDRFDIISIANSKITGDRNGLKVIDCLTSIVAMYGEKLITFQYLPHMSDLIAMCRRRLSIPLEGGVVACLQFIKYLLPAVRDVELMEQLPDTFLKTILQPALRIASTTRCAFPGGATARGALTRKLLDALYALALRIGPEMTRRHICVPALQRFFLTFDKANQEDTAVKMSSTTSESKTEEFIDISPDGTTTKWTIQNDRVARRDLPGATSTPPSSEPSDSVRLTAQEELLSVFNQELAYQAYTTFSKFVGVETMERCLKNFDSIQTLCQKYEGNLLSSTPILSRPEKRVQQSFSDEPISRKSVDIAPSKTDGLAEDHVACSNSFGSNVTLVGNRIDIASDLNDMGFRGQGFDVVAYKADNVHKNNRHLHGDWLIYWEHEIGRPEKETRFNLKQIKLQTFVGHTQSVKSIYSLDNENSFMSGSKDKTVKLWSLRNQGDGNATTQCNWTYTGHKKGVLSLSFLESLRLAVSTDSVVHIWDPFMESVVSQLDSIKIPVSIVRTLPGPSPVVIAATTDATLRLIDARASSYTHELKLPLVMTTFIRCMCVSDSGSWVACGLASGHVCVLDVRTGLPRTQWRAHDGEVLRLTAVDNHRLLTSGLDQVTALWNAEDGELIAHLKGTTEPVHCLSVYYNELISGTTNNRIGVHTSLDHEASFSSTKLRSDTFKGILTCMSVLPLNRLLLLGSDNGTISLLC